MLDNQILAPGELVLTNQNKPPDSLFYSQPNLEKN